MAEETLPSGESLLLPPWPGCAGHIKRLPFLLFSVKVRTHFLLFSVKVRAHFLLFSVKVRAHFLRKCAAKMPSVGPAVVLDGVVSVQPDGLRVLVKTEVLDTELLAESFEDFHRVAFY